MATSSAAVALGTPAPAFSLPSTDGRRVALEDFDDRPALVVAFLCNHCPYVRHIEAELARVTSEYAAHGLASVGISANDVRTYPDDDLEHLAGQAARAGFTFPYLFDETQEVAQAYGAVCTPDLFLFGALFDGERKLAYRGQFDSARPGNALPVTGDSLRAALDLVLAGKTVPGPHRPSVGCSIKWKPGHEPTA